jgi:hypothetical protein
MRKISIGLVLFLVALLVSLGATPTPASSSSTAIIAEIINQVDEQQFRTHICYWQSQEGGEECNSLGSRWSCSPTAIDRALGYGQRYFESLGLKTQSDAYNLPCRSGPSSNLTAEWPGTESSKLVLITAHVDSVIFGMGPSQAAPGADDNASGSAAVLEAARILSKYRFKHTIHFVLFTGEEQGLIGSRAYASRMAGQGAQILGVFNMDMIGYDSDRDGAFEIHAGTREGPIALARLMVNTLKTFEIKLTPDVLESGATNRSDHGSFWRHNYPAVLVIEDTEYGATNDFNPHYHSVNDTLSHLDLSYAKRIAQAVIGAAAQLAEPVP